MIPEEGIWFGSKKFFPLPLKPDERRYMPLTRPDSEAYDHMVRFGVRHTCEVCERPAAQKHIRPWARDQGLTPG